MDLHPNPKILLFKLFLAIFFQFSVTIFDVLEIKETFMVDVKLTFSFIFTFFAGLLFIMESISNIFNEHWMRLEPTLVGIEEVNLP